MARDKILGNFRQLQKSINLVFQATPGLTILNLLLVVLQSGMPLLQLFFMKLLVDTVTAAITTPNHSLAEKQTFYLICSIGAVAVLATILSSISKIATQTQADIITDHVQDVMHAKSIALDLEYYEDHRFFDTLHRAQQEAPYRPTRIVNSIVQATQNGISFVAIAGLLFSCHWGIAIILLVAILPEVFVRLNFADTFYAWKSKTAALERASGYFNWILTSETHAKEIRMNDLGDHFSQRFHDVRQKLRKQKTNLSLSVAKTESIVQLLGLVAIYCSLAFVAWKTIRGAMTLGDMVMYYQAFQRGQGYFQETLNGLTSLYENNLFLSNFYEFLSLKPTGIIQQPPVAVPNPICQGIVFDHVDFKYPSSHSLALQDISLSIPPGQVVAFVGENGSGKTTLIKLLCRLYAPNRGAIKVDGVDIRTFETKVWHGNIGILFQDYVHYEMTARENIWVGNTKLPSSDQRIIASAKYSGADIVLKKLPHGYDTMLGKRFENGVELSIGEWQKVALARAFLRDAQIIILDEPTSSLDARAEYEVYENFKKLVAGRIGILISHRFSSIQMADHIYVMRNGRIIENGTHHQLIEKNGAYANLYNIQTQFFKET